MCKDPSFVLRVQLSLNYQQYFLPHMVQYVCDEQPEVRQAAAYGVGVIAQYGGPGYAQVLNGKIYLSFCAVTKLIFN